MLSIKCSTPSPGKRKEEEDENERDARRKRMRIPSSADCAGSTRLFFTGQPVYVLPLFYKFLILLHDSASAMRRSPCLQVPHPGQSDDAVVSSSWQSVDTVVFDVDV